MTDGKAYLRAPEIAALTGASLRTVRRWIKNKVVASTKVGGARLVAITDLEATLRSSHGPAQATFYDPKQYDDNSSK